MALCLLLRLFVFRLLRLKRFSTLTLRCFDLYRYCWRPCFVWKECRSEERFSRNAETDLVCRLLLEKKKRVPAGMVIIDSGVVFVVVVLSHVLQPLSAGDLSTETVVYV